MKLYTTINEFRSERSKGVIAEFSKDHFDETLHFSRIGKGSLGGKGRGLAFISMEMHANSIPKEFPDLDVVVPRTVVVTTEYFDVFMEENKLSSLYFIEESDEEILRLFLSKKFPEKLLPQELPEAGQKERMPALSVAFVITGCIFAGACLPLFAAYVFSAEDSLLLVLLMLMSGAVAALTAAGTGTIASGTARFSLSAFNREDEVSRLIGELKKFTV